MNFVLEESNMLCEDRMSMHEKPFERNQATCEKMSKREGSLRSSNSMISSACASKVATIIVPMSVCDFVTSQSSSSKSHHSSGKHRFQEKFVNVIVVEF